MKSEDPGRILVIRFHAIGDVALTLPACLALRRRFPKAQIDLLTSPEAAPLAGGIQLFDGIHSLEQPSGKTEQLRTLLSVAGSLRRVRYQVVLDLQRNWKSRFIRRSIHPAAWSEFDRFSLMPACERTLRTLENAGIHSLSPLFVQQFKPDAGLDAETVLRSHGWQRGDHLVLLNPAGLWETRNWPLNHYAELVCTWPDSAARFLLLGTGRIKEASRFLSSKAGNRMIDLSGQTSLALAYALLQFVDCAITEDSGLMHMAWSQGIPLVALFGSSPHYWSLPAGDFVHAFHSGDLSCGACMQSRCKYGDNRCLTRVTPDLVIRAAESLMRKQRMERNG